ncbi:MAG: hypothetical protein ACLP9L_06140, partial [Thermoguttaceae bacterium]
MGSIAVDGCNRGISGLVPVSGKLTYNGGPWPKTGSINFSPLPVEGKKLLPAMAHVEKDGAFVVKSADSLGLRPGEYLVTIRCWLETPSDNESGKSALPERYSSPNTSKLKLT